MVKETSPEERLLSLIKKKARKEESGPEPKIPQAPETEVAKIIKTNERISKVLKSELFKNKLFEPASLKNLNRYLILVFAFLILYFVIDLAFVRPYKNVQLLVSKASGGGERKILPSGTKEIAVVKDYSSYASAAPSRVVFGQYQAAPSGEAAISSGAMSDQIGLVGIIAGDNPQAIIEDKKAQKTYYLNKGQSFDGYVVEEISENKVTLDCEGKKIALFL
ncbi:MAG: hypothetical protein WC522_04305 [Candidatus Omnitrophota bacterium]